MKVKDITEGVGRITKQNQTVDVGPDEVTKQAAKFGNKVDKDGRPPTLSKKVKGSSTNVAFNLGMVEGKQIPNPKNTFLSKSDTAYDFIRVGKSISNLSNAKKSDNRDEPDVMIVPFGGKKEKDHLKKGLKKAGYKTQDADKPGDDAQVDENFAKDTATAIKLIKKYHQTGDEQDAFAAIKHGWNFIKNPKMRSIIVNLVKKVSTENGYPSWDTTVAYIKKNTGIDVSNVNENFADGKKKGKSRPGRVKKSGASCNGSVTSLRKKAKNASGERAKMYHWCANMKGGKK